RGRRRRQQMAVTSGEPHHQRRGVFGQSVRVGLIFGEEDTPHSRDLRRGFGDPAAIVAGNDDVDIVSGNFRGGGERVERRRLQFGVVVFGDDKSSHQITRASVLSLSTSSVTEPTLRPPCRFGGSSTLSTASLGVTSTPSASGVVVTIGFFLARMML